MDDKLALGRSFGQRSHLDIIRVLSPFLSLFPRDVGSLGVWRLVAGFNAWSGDLTSCVLSSSMIMHEIALFFFHLRIFQMADTNFDLIINSFIYGQSINSK